MEEDGVGMTEDSASASCLVRGQRSSGRVFLSGALCGSASRGLPVISSVCVDPGVRRDQEMQQLLPLGLHPVAVRTTCSCLCDTCMEGSPRGHKSHSLGGALL